MNAEDLKERFYIEYDGKITSDQDYISWLEKIIIDSTTAKNNKPIILNVSKLGIIVDKSKATKTYGGNIIPFPKGSILNP